jgi:hypothetical protein
VNSNTLSVAEMTGMRLEAVEKFKASARQKIKRRNKRGRNKIMEIY